MSLRSLSDMSLYSVVSSWLCQHSIYILSMESGLFSWKYGAGMHKRGNNHLNTLPHAPLLPTLKMSLLEIYLILFLLLQFLTDCCSSSPWCYLASCITIYLLSPSFDFSIKHSFYKLSTLFHFLFFPNFCQLFSCSALLEPLYVFFF